MIVGWDFETHKIREGMVAPRPVCMSTSMLPSSESVAPNKPQPFLAIAPNAAILSTLRHHLKSTSTLVGHNTAYDLVCAMAEWPELARLIFDAVDDGRVRCTFIRQCLLDVATGEAEFRRRWIEAPREDGTLEQQLKVIRSGRALDDLVLLYFNEVLPKEDRIRLGYGELDGVPISEWPEDFQEYVRRDANEPVRLFDAQAEIARSLAARPDMEGVWCPEGDEDIPDERPQTRAALWLQLMSAWGLRTCPEAVKKLRGEHEASQAEIRARLQPTGMIRADGTRDMKVIQARVVAAYSALENLEAPRTPKGAVKTDTDTLVESADPDLMALGESLSDASTVGTWLPWLEMGTTIPICVGYNPVLETGRASARKPNIMNPPRKGAIRACFRARPDTVYVFADYATAELRALAQVCIWLLGWSDLGDALRNGEDPHLSLAADLEGITYAEALALSAAGDKQIKDTRQLCKVPNFGLPGGLGAEKLVMYAHGYDPRFKKIVDIKVANKLRSAWFKKWREMRPYFECVSQAVGRDGEGSIQQFGSRRVRGRCGFTQAANGTFQGLVADGAKRAGWALARECYLGDWMYPPANDVERAMREEKMPSPLLNSRPVLFMHDEFGLEVPYLDPMAASAAADRQAYVQRRAMQDLIPDVPIECSAVMTRVWHKGAEAVRDADGFMVPCKPEESSGKTIWVRDAA